MVAMGLHQGNRVDAETPFFLAELRKRIFISAYGHDKVVATFLGRPPRLSHRYCKMEPPLDLSDDQRLLQGADLDAALANLDDNGWNVSGNLNRSTWQRVWFQHCRIREDILEVALGSGDEDITKQAEHIRLKLERMHESYPSFMRVSPEELLSRSDLYVAKGFATMPLGSTEPLTRQINAIFTLCIHAGIIHTEFLLQRALVNRMRKDTKELIPISKRMLGLVLLAQSNRDFFRDFQGELVYMVRVLLPYPHSRSTTLTHLPARKPRPPRRWRPRHRTPQTRAVPPLHPGYPPPQRNDSRPERLHLEPGGRRARGGKLQHLQSREEGAEEGA